MVAVIFCPSMGEKKHTKDWCAPNNWISTTTRHAPAHSQLIRRVFWIIWKRSHTLRHWWEVEWLRLHKTCGVVHWGRGIFMRRLLCSMHLCALSAARDDHFLIFSTRVNLVSADERCKRVRGEIMNVSVRCISQPCCSTPIGPNIIIQFSACATPKADFSHNNWKFWKSSSPLYYYHS